MTLAGDKNVENCEFLSDPRVNPDYDGSNLLQDGQNQPLECVARNLLIFSGHVFFIN